MREGDIRCDRVLLAMVEEVGAKYGGRWDRFALFGFSGGGHFTRRFAILHPPPADLGQHAGPDGVRGPAPHLRRYGGHGFRLLRCARETGAAPG